MEPPASYYGKLDQRNPVVLALERDIKSLMTLTKRVAASKSQGDSNSSYAKGIQNLLEIWRNYKHRLPSKMYQERMLRVADFLYGIKLYQLALWQGYSLHLLQFSVVKITDITSVDHFMACFFPDGFDADHEEFATKIRAMQGCALCIFELEKKPNVLRQDGLCELLRVLNFIRIMMQAFQQHEHLYWQIYNGSLHIYTICRYLMTMKCSAQALEYLLWASMSLELSVPLMTAKYLPWIVTLYCAVCHCYYDNEAAVQAEEFARRALGKINELAKLEEQSEVPATREARRAYKEASIKLGAMIFKRTVYEAKRRPKPTARVKTKSTLKEIPTVPRPRTSTQRMLVALFDGGAAQFLGILEALWESKRHPLQVWMPDEPERREVILELLSAGISILSGVPTTGEKNCDDRPSTCLSALTPTSTLMDLAIAGENRVSITSAVRLAKLLFQYKQPDAFAELTGKMLQVLSGVEGLAFRKAESELALLDSFNSLLSEQRSRPTDMIHDSHKSLSSVSDEFMCVVDTLHRTVCVSAPDVQPDGDLVLDVVLFLWGDLKVVMQRNKIQNPEKVQNCDKWLWCLSTLCEVAFAYDLATVDCIIMTEMIHTFVLWLEKTAERSNQTQHPAPATEGDGGTKCSLSFLERSNTEVLQKVCEVASRGLKSLEMVAATLLPQDGSAVTDSAFMQKFCSHPHPTPSPSPRTSSEEEVEDDKISKQEKEEVETRAKSDLRDSGDTQSTCVPQLAIDLHLELNIIHHRAALKLLQLNAVAESQVLDRIKKNKVSKALFLTQKALLVCKSMETNKSSKTKSLLEEASSLVEKAELEERRLYTSVTSTTPAQKKDSGMKDEGNPPPPPMLLSRTDSSLTFAPAPYHLEEQVCWYQLCGRVAEGIIRRVHLGDCSLPGTGHLVPAMSGRCQLRVEGLVPNQKYVFAVAAYNSQGKLLGNTIGRTTFPLLASMPVRLLCTWAHIAQVAFQTEHYTIAKKVCKELWSHYTLPEPGSHSSQDGLANTTRLNERTLQRSSPKLCALFLNSIFIETEINILQGSLFCDSFSDNGPFIWEKEARLTECERLLVAMDFALHLNDGIAAGRAVVSCYGLLAPLIFHQVPCDTVVQVLKKCLTALEENLGLLKKKWTGNISKSFMHMIACITYYLTKSLRVLGEHRVAFAVMDCSHRLLKEVFETIADHAATKGEKEMCLQLKALHVKNEKKLSPEAAHNAGNDVSPPLTGCKESTILYDLISSCTIKDAYQHVMKLRGKAYFTEYAVLLLQRTLKEGHPDLVLKWGQSILEFLSRRDEALLKSTKGVKEKSHSKRGHEPPEKPSHDDTRKTIKQKMSHSMLESGRTQREMQVVENLLTRMSSVVQRIKKRRQLRNLCCEERVWRSQLNFTMAQAHLALLYPALERLHGGALQHRYSQFNPLCFSLAHSGVLLWRTSQHRQQSTKDAILFPSHSGLGVREASHKKEALSDDDSIAGESRGATERDTKTAEQQMDMNCLTAPMLLDSLNKAAAHLQRAMVLAHRGRHWTTLLGVCQSVWEQSSRIVFLQQTPVPLGADPPLTAGQLHTTIAPLLTLATDLIMDMLNTLGLWSLYDSDSTEEELESSLHFSAPLDDSTQVDLRWVRTLVLNTLERLHDGGKWESLAHFALLFNSYTRDRYALVIIPLLIHAQRRLLERISCVGGPAVPQPHHVKTQRVTGNEVTYRSYAGCQLLSGWNPHQEQQTTNPTNEALTNATSQDAADHKGAEMQPPACLVCVPLNVEDTLSHYHQALERRPRCLHVFQHSRSLLWLLLAYTQPGFVLQLKHCPPASRVNFSPKVRPTPSVEPRDLTEEDYSTLNALYSLPISNEHIPTVSAAYSASIECLQASGHDSLRVQALHEMGNLHFYNKDLRAAHSCWSRAVDCALQSSDTVEKWDGVSFGSDSLQQTLKQAGIWGCLQAAALTAKIAQHILTSDISQRTNCCLLSAHLFKCVLCCSPAQPQADLLYASHAIGDQLLPGVDLFSEPHRVDLGTTVTSLNFVCHWLFTTGYCITLLPLLALYLHFVGTVCRDVQRCVEGKILKIRALTELSLFTEASRETVQLTQGMGVTLPNGHYIAQDDHQPVKTFYSNKCLLHNAKALEELVNCDLAPGARTLYGATLCLWFNLARIQLVLALSNSLQGPPTPGEACVNITTCSVNSKDHEQDRLETESPCLKPEELKVLDLDTKKQLTTERIKYLMLEGVSSLLHSITQQLTSLCCSEMENMELVIETNLQKANLYLQQGKIVLSSEMAVSSLALLQTSPVIRRTSIPDSQEPMSGLSNRKSRKEQAIKDSSVSHHLLGDSPRAVDASERIGVCLWLRCRLALVRSLTAYISGSTAAIPGKNKEEAARVIEEGLNECAQWGDLDIQALLMVEAAKLKSLRGNTGDSMAMLQGAVSLLSGRTCTPPMSSVTLAHATLLLSDLRRGQSTTLIKLTQKLLEKQLYIFGENVALEDGKMCFSASGPSNIYLPYLSILDQTNLRIGK